MALIQPCPTHAKNIEDILTMQRAAIVARITQAASLLEGDPKAALMLKGLAAEIERPSPRAAA